jgi:catechol 2,3-dioxygenase-like lactoylglutathione lyase family enzyme
MASSFDLVTIDAVDTDATARFWSVALGLHEVEREDVDRWVVLADGDGVRRLGIQRGVTNGGSMHLDLACEPAEFDPEIERLVELGARLVAPARREAYGSIANLLDPDGNPFDLCAYR